MRRLVICLTLFSVLLGLFIGIKLRAYQAGSYTVFTAETKEEAWVGGKITRTRTFEDSFFADGSHVQRRLIWNGVAQLQKVVEDATAGKRIAVDGATRSITTYPLKSAAISSRTPATTCTGANPNQSSQVLGHVVLNRTRDLGKGRGANWTHIDEWVAPGLNCYSLAKTQQLMDINGNVLESLVATTTSVNMTADPEVKNIPSDFTERAPSEVLGLAATQDGRVCTECGTTAASHLDDVYQQSNAKAKAK
jgi:hypothetical protein